MLEAISPRHNTSVPTDPAIRIDATRQDISALNNLLRSGIRIENEQQDRDEYLNGLITKPWGQEYRAFVDDFLDIWHLQINPGQSTSVHAHPRKTTYLLCLSGSGVSTNLKSSVLISQGTILRIGRGAFHATKCDDGTEPLMLIEVETPRNKFDLVRLADNYDRAAKQYEPEGTPLPAGRRRHPQFPNASFCPVSPCGRFKFSIRTGMDVFYRSIADGAFLIKLGIDALLSDDMIILSDQAREKENINTDAHYLCVEAVGA